MPQFEVQGYGRESGRRRKRAYDAKDEDEALLKAAEDGTIVENIEHLPDHPATPRQIAYARDLGLKFSSDISAEEMRDLLDRRLREDALATEKQIKFAQKLGLTFPPDITKDQMSDLLDQHLAKDSSIRIHVSPGKAFFVLFVFVLIVIWLARSCK